MSNGGSHSRCNCNVRAAGGHVGHRIDTWARQTKHADGITWFLSELETETREASSSEPQWTVPTSRSDRAYNWGDSAIAPDAVGHLVAGGLHVPFYLEHELRARHPRGVIARLSPYASYYWSPEHEDDQPPFPTTLFVVDTEEVEATYVRTAPALPILVSCITVLSNTGILGAVLASTLGAGVPRLSLSGLRSGAPRRSAARPSHPPRAHPGDERREPPPEGQPGEHRLPAPGPT